jgi:plastocyanin
MPIETIHTPRPPSRHTAGAAILFAITAAAACGGDSGGGGNGPGGGLTVARASVSGNGQSGTVGQALANPIRVLVERDGQPEVGATVNWSTSGTGASVTPTSSLTDALGEAAATWTLPQEAGARSASASVAGANGSPVSFSATAVPGSATTLALRSGNAQTATAGTVLPQPLKVKATDQFGNGVAGVMITWQVTGGGGSVGPLTSTTDTTGATTAWTLGAAEGAQTADASATGLTGSPVAFTATATAVPPTPVDVVVGNNFFSPANATVTAGRQVRWTWTSTGSIPHSVHSTGSPSFTSSSTLTGNGSVYTFTFNTPGVYTYDCAVHGAGMAGTITVN